MITVTKEPPSIASFADPAQPPIPLSDCLEFCFQPDVADVFTSTGQKATVEITIPAVCTIPANGTTFSIWGQDLTIESSPDYTSTSFAVDAIGLLTVVNLAGMLYGNIFFQRALTFDLAIVGSDYVVTLTWKECREQSNFSGANMDLAVFTTIGGSAVATNGISPVYVEAYRMLFRPIRWTDATSAFVPLTPFSGIDVEKLCDTVGENCFKINSDVGADLFTILPPLNNTSFIEAIDNGRSMMRFYSTEYGWTYRENCVAKSGTIDRSDRVLVLNAAFDVDDPYQMRRYWFDHPDGFPAGQSVVDYLTRQPKTIPLCDDSVKWLWFLNNWQDSFPQYVLRANWIAYAPDGSIFATYSETINDPAVDASSNYQPVCFNASPSHLFDVLGAPRASVGCYEIQCVGVNPANFADLYFNATEYLKFCPTACCDDSTDVYFLSPTGSIDTVVVKIDTVEILQSDGVEIKIDLPCDTDRIDAAANGGRTLVSTRAFQRIKMSVQTPRSSEWERWMKDLKQSPQRWIRVTDESGEPIAKKILFESGGVTIKQSGSGTLIEMIGYLQDIPTQKGTEQPFI